MGLGKSKIYDLMDAGRLDYVKIDSVRRIPMDAICEFIERHRVAARKSKHAPPTVARRRRGRFEGSIYQEAVRAEVRSTRVGAPLRAFGSETAPCVA